MAKFLLPDEDDQRILKEMIRQFRRQRHNPQAQNVPPTDDPQSSETYIALPPEGGIPALSRIGTSPDPQDGDTPGSVDCDIYKITSALGDLEKVGSNSKKVYNLSSAIIEQDWVLVSKTKFGSWVASETVVLPLLFKEGVLTENLLPATSSNDGPTTANLLVYGPPETGTGGWVSTGETIVVTNRLTEVATIVSGTWMGVISTNGEFRPVVADCGPSVLA